MHGPTLRRVAILLEETANDLDGVEFPYVGKADVKDIPDGLEAVGQSPIKQAIEDTKLVSGFVTESQVREEFSPESVFDSHIHKGGVESDTTTPVSDNAELDARGMPWDDRIHASTKSKLANGNWKNKRGVDRDLLESVEAELLGTIPQEPSDNCDENAPKIPAGHHDVEGTPPPPPPPPPPAQPDTNITNFMELMRGIKIAEVPDETVAKALADVGIASLPLIATRADLIPVVAKALGL